MLKRIKFREIREKFHKIGANLGLFFKRRYPKWEKIHASLTLEDGRPWVYVEFGAHISATFISANTTRRRQSQRLFKSAPSNTALTHFGDLHFSEHNSPLPNTAPIEIV